MAWDSLNSGPRGGLGVLTRRGATGDVFGQTLQPYQKHDGGCSAPGPVGDRAREGAEMGAETECTFCACFPTSKKPKATKSVAVKSLNEPVLKLLRIELS